MTPKQERFCEEYLVDLNSKQAAIRCGYSARTAKDQAARLMTYPSIQAYIEKLRKKQSDRTNIKADAVLAEIYSLGFWNIKDYLDDNNQVKDLSKLPKEMLRPVLGVKVRETYENGNRVVTTELKMSDKMSSLNVLGRHLGIFEKDNRQKTDVSVMFVNEDEEE